MKKPNGRLDLMKTGSAVTDHELSISDYCTNVSGHIKQPKRDDIKKQMEFIPDITRNSISLPPMMKKTASVPGNWKMRNWKSQVRVPEKIRMGRKLPDIKKERSSVIRG